MKFLLNPKSSTTLTGLVLFAAISLVSGRACAQTKAPQSQAVLQEKLQQLIDQYDIPGAVLSYKIGNGPIVTIPAGYASLAPKQKMKDDTLFLVGSITKSFTSALVLHLADQQKVSLDESLGQISEAYPGHIRRLVSQYPSLRGMTIRELLNHTSGVPQSINTKTFKAEFSRDPHKYYTPEVLMNIAMQHAVYFKPGAKGKWSYTNTDYVLVGLIIEDVTRRSLADNFSQLIESLSLENVYFANRGIIPKGLNSRLANGYIPVSSTDRITKAFKNSPVVRLPSSKAKNYQLKDAS